jgi:hypothetical protein
MCVSEVFLKTPSEYAKILLVWGVRLSADIRAFRQGFA